MRPANMIDKMNVLLVDDDPIAHLINRKTLQRIGLTMIDSASNGVEALNYVGHLVEGQSRPNVIFVDLNMPVLDGFGFIEEFKRSSIPHKEDIQIAILTSSYDPGDKKRASELGVTHYLTKPVTEDGLRAVLESTPDKAA